MASAALDGQLGVGVSVLAGAVTLWTPCSGPGFPLEPRFPLLWNRADLAVRKANSEEEAPVTPREWVPAAIAIWEIV